MYADRFTGQSRFHPGGLAAAVAINAGVVAALMVAAPHIGLVEPTTPIEVYPVPLDPVPEPQPRPEPQHRASRPIERPDAPEPEVPTQSTDDRLATSDPLPFPGPLDLGGTTGGTGTGPTVADPLPPPPVIVGPSVDPRYAADLQPAYPAGEQRLQREGRVTVKVLIGPDGRVRQVERVSATSDAFFAATQAQALRRWRFRPGTRDGVPQEAWRTMTVTFKLED